MTYLRTLSRWLALAGGALLLVAARPAPPAGHHPVADRTSMVTVTPSGSHLLGDPAAKVKLTEYISYTCPHCAHFNAEAEATLRLTFVAPGKGSIEVRPFILNPIDMAAALLVDCAGPQHFVRMHDTFLSTQDAWKSKLEALNDTQRQRWETGPIGGRLRAIAGDLDFYQIARNNGVDQVQADRCLSNEAAAKRLADQTQAAATAGVTGTPAFAIDGVVLTGTHDWTMLAPQLQARL